MFFTVSDLARYFKDLGGFMLTHLGLLILRVGFGSTLLLGHGWGKLMRFSELTQSFPDPLGVGSTLSLILALFGEVLCPLAMIVGFKTRFAAIPALITMAVAFFLFHGDDPWQKKELAAVYGIAFIAIACLGSGRYSIDGLRGKV